MLFAGSSLDKARAIFAAACWPATATALLLALIARDAIGMPPGVVREDALIAASVMIAAVGGMPSRKPRTRSTVVIARRRKGIFTDRLSNLSRISKAMLDELEAPARHGYHAISHAPGPRTQWRIRPHCPIMKVVPSG
jgi:hypothetical protein